MQLGRMTVVIAGIGLAACNQQEADLQADEAAEIKACRQLPVDIDPRKSLYVTDDAILLSGGQDFSLARTLNQLASQSGAPGLNGLQLFRQWWDTQNVGPGLGLGANCDDELVNGQPSINGYPIDCPRAEGTQAGAQAQQHLDSYIPIALVNRFDLAPTDGSNCGEYRIVYGKTSFGIRSLPIFEAKLKNPHPECGIAACRPVVQFWASLTNVSSPAQRAQMLAKFYYHGLPGFDPVVKIENYTGSGGPYSGASGQIRTNQFMQGPWDLREFNLVHNKANDPPSLVFQPVSVKTNPFGNLFNGDLPGSNDPLAGIAREFQAHFLTQIDNLSVPDLNGFGHSVPDVHNAGQSDMSGFGPSDYLSRFNDDGGSSPFRAMLDAKLAGSNLIADDIINRATTQSCAGCHLLSNSQPLGGGLVWPSSLGFVHGSEFSSEQGPDGPRKIISDALENVFLPHRESINESYLSRGRCIACASPADPIVAVDDGPKAEPTDKSADTIGGIRTVH